MLTQKDSPRPVAQIFVTEALENGAAAGVDTRQLLLDLGLDPAALSQLDTRQFGDIWLELSKRMRDEFFGLGARAMRPGSTTLMGHAIRGAPTLEVALRRMLRFLNATLDDPSAEMDETTRDCTITVTEANPSGNAFKYRAFFLIVHGFNCWAARERIPLKTVGFPCAEPRVQNDYGDFFGVPVRFGTDRAQLVFDRSFLSRRVERSEKDLKTFLRSLPEAFLRGYRDADGIKHVIIQTCLSGPPADWPDAEQIADELQISRSTLHRLLKRSGHSLTALKDEQRRNRATALLSRTNLPVAAVAEAVGFAEEAAFYRAFKRWYAASPTSLRRP